MGSTVVMWAAVATVALRILELAAQEVRWRRDRSCQAAIADAAIVGKAPGRRRASDRSGE